MQTLEWLSRLNAKASSLEPTIASTSGDKITPADISLLLRRLLPCELSWVEYKYLGDLSLRPVVLDCYQSMAFKNDVVRDWYLCGKCSDTARFSRSNNFFALTQAILDQFYDGYRCRYCKGAGYAGPVRNEDTECQKCNGNGRRIPTDYQTMQDSGVNVQVLSRYKREIQELRGILVSLDMRVAAIVAENKVEITG